MRSSLKDVQHTEGKGLQGRSKRGIPWNPGSPWILPHILSYYLKRQGLRASESPRRTQTCTLLTHSFGNDGRLPFERPGPGLLSKVGKCRYDGEKEFRLQ